MASLIFLFVGVDNNNIPVIIRLFFRVSLHIYNYSWEDTKKGKREVKINEREVKRRKCRID